MLPGASEGSLHETRLDSWKSIAQHLGRSSRTVQRWHLSYGMPVYRLSGASGAIFAYAEELDDWLRRRSKIERAGLALVSPPKSATNPIDRHPSDSEQYAIDPSLISSGARTRATRLVQLAGMMWGSLSARNLTRILHHYREAIELDPGNAQAFAGLSLSLISQGLWGAVNLPVAYSSAWAALEHSFRINPDTPGAKCALAWLNVLSTRDWHSARIGFDALEKEEPNGTRTLNGRGLLHVAEGNLEEAGKLFKRASDEYPLAASSIGLYCWSLYLSGEYASVVDHVCQVRSTGRSGPVLDAVQAMALIQLGPPAHYLERIEARVLEMPQHDTLRGALGYAYGITGNVQRAHGVLDAMTNPAKPGNSREPYAVALVLIGLNEFEKAVHWLERAYREGSLWSLAFPMDPILKSLHNDQNFKQFMAKASYPETHRTDPRMGFAS